MNNLILELVKVADRRCSETRGVFDEILVKVVAEHCAGICLEMAAQCGGLPGDGALAKDCADWIMQDFEVEHELSN